VLVISEVVGQKGAYPFLNRIYQIGDVVTTTKLDELIAESDISQELFSDFTNTGLFTSTPQGFYISSLGKKVVILLRCINGDSSNIDLFNELTSLQPESRPYELITEGITDYFIDSMDKYCDFIRIRICSPWIRLSDEHLEKLKAAVAKTYRMYKNLEIFVISLPKERYWNWKASIPTFKTLKDLGATIVTINNLHTKLYISEPGPYGGSHYAILGSENLTGRGNIELAIRIEHDNDILRKLNLYFDEIKEKSDLLKEV
jgi:hypothetical protein